ncbi:MAG TPA: ABC-2 family transporter protein [Micromonosporaceae bacterium]
MSPRTFVALVAAGFRRWSAYRQATAASAFTNTVFGFLKVYVLFAVATGAGGAVAGYDPAMLASYVWFGQGLIGVVMLFTWTDLADRVRTGEVTADLLRPVDPMWSYLAADLGRAGHAVLFRLMLPVAVGAVFFDLYAPHRWLSYPLFAASVLLAVVVSFAFRYLVNLTAFWLLDVRGAIALWLVGSTLLSGLAFPIWFLPDWAQWLLWLGTPFPAMVQGPLDVYIEYADLPGQLLVLADQALWVGLGLVLCRWVQHRAVRKLVIQGG